MSSLTFNEKRVLEECFGMRGGYVLDLSNRTFKDLVLDSVGLDIDAVEIGGLGSKASRLRYFWSNQPDHVVGKLIRDLMDYGAIKPDLKEQGRVVAARLSSGHRLTSQRDHERIWGPVGYRVFLSHKTEVGVETAQLKNSLKVFGISGFVAHADIKPTRQWQDEIENALASMHAFVALLTKDFHNSNWTDQEVGYALCRCVPMVAVKLGRDPYGFIGKFQALSSDWARAPVEIAKLLIAQPQMVSAFIEAAAACSSYDEGNEMAKLLPHIDTLEAKQADQLAAAFNENTQLQDSYGFSGAWNSRHGPGLASHLTRITGKTYEMKEIGQLGIKIPQISKK